MNDPSSGAQVFALSSRGLVLLPQGAHALGLQPLQEALLRAGALSGASVSSFGSGGATFPLVGGQALSQVLSLPSLPVAYAFHADQLLEHQLGGPTPQPYAATAQTYDCNVQALLRRAPSADGTTGPAVRSPDRISQQLTSSDRSDKSDDRKDARGGGGGGSRPGYYSRDGELSDGPPSAKKRARSAAAPLAGLCDKEKNRQAQRRFRERQKVMITNLKDEVTQLHKKLSESDARIWELERDNITLKAKLEACQGQPWQLGAGLPAGLAGLPDKKGWRPTTTALYPAKRNE